MRIKYKSYEGTLLSMDERGIARVDGEYFVAGYDLRIILDDGAIVEIERARENDIEIKKDV
jgi:hypothetical protein